MYIKKFKIVVFFVVGIQSSTAQPQPEFKQFRFEQTLLLGEDKPVSQEYLFGSPRKLCTDSRRRIYLGDQKVEGIRVYDEEGNYVKTLGRSGQGPGEFREISDLTITPDDRLLVIDRSQIRVTEFDVSSASVEQLGEEVQTYNLPEERVVSPIQTVALSNGEFVSAYRIYTNWPGQPGPLGPDEMLHFVGPEWENIIHRAFSYDYLGDLDNAYVDHKIGNPTGTLRMAAVNSSTIAVSPYLYEGEIFLVEKREGRKWEYSRKIKGYVEEPAAYEFYSNPSSAPAYANRAGSSTAAINNESIGLFKTAEGSLVHVTFILHEGERKYFVEKYNPELELVEYGPITNLNIHEKRPVTRRFYSLWLDEKDQLYIYDFRNLDEDGPQIRRGYITAVKE